jgi:hypothetical protein
LVDGVSEDEANLIFNNAACKVIKDAFKHARCISIASYYTKVNLLLFCTYVLKLLFFTLQWNLILFCTQVLKQQIKPTHVHGIYLTQDHHLQGTADWLVKDLKALDWLYGWWVSHQFRAVSEQNRQNRLSKESVHHYGAYGHIRKT